MMVRVVGKAVRVKVKSMALVKAMDDGGCGGVFISSTPLFVHG